MILIAQHGEEYWISFPYHPRIVDLVKSVPHRTWDKDKKVWYIPKDDLGLLLAQFRGTEFEDMVSIRSSEHINENETLDDKPVIPDYDLSDIDLLPGLYDHQQDFMKFALDRQYRKGNMSGFIVADDMGCGKSLEAMQLALHNREMNGFEHCLILCCVNTSKYNWRDEVSKHTEGKESGYILGTRKRKRKGGFSYSGSSKDKLEDLRTGHMYGDPESPELPYFIIANIESLRYKERQKALIADEIMRMINDGSLSMIVIDEVHKNVSPKSIQGKQLLRIKNKSKGACMWLPMTGTPIVNKPTDLFTPLRLVDAHEETAYSRWIFSFCVKGGFENKQIIGYKNMKLLKAMLYPNMIRRLKSDVLDLPEKIEIIDYVENTPVQQSMYDEVENAIINDRDRIVKSLNPLAKFMRLRQVNGSPELVDDEIMVDSKYLSVNAKMRKLTELVKDILDLDEKMVIFSNWVEPLRVIYKILKPIHKNICVFTGTMSADQSFEQKERFINDPSSKIILGTIDALGTTHTLTVANHVIFYDEPWTYANRNQAIDRCHRIGSTKNLTVHTIISQDTIDDRVHDIVFTKKGVSQFIVDGSLDIYNNPKLFDLLLAHD